MLHEKTSAIVKQHCELQLIINILFLSIDISFWYISVTNILKYVVGNYNDHILPSHGTLLPFLLNDSKCISDVLIDNS